MVAAPDAKDDPPAGQDVGHRVILGQPQRMPHRHDVEAAADVQVLRDAAQMHRHHQEIGDQFRAFGLEMMLGHPERVVAALVHAFGVDILQEEPPEKNEIVQRCRPADSWQNQLAQRS
jgi:hypothetical protein